MVRPQRVSDLVGVQARRLAGRKEFHHFAAAEKDQQPLEMAGTMEKSSDDDDDDNDDNDDNDDDVIVIYQVYMYIYILCS